jgi:hypothetical protein
MNVGCEITVAEVKPGFAAEDAESLQEMKSFAAHAPSRGGIHNAGEGVGNDIEVGGNFQSVKNDVVTGIDDDGEIVRIHGLVEAEKQFRSADSAGKSGNRRFSGGRHGGVKDARRKEILASKKRMRAAED